MRKENIIIFKLLFSYIITIILLLLLLLLLNCSYYYYYYYYFILLLLLLFKFCFQAIIISLLIREHLQPFYVIHSLLLINIFYLKFLT